jgi:hypothetical protein
MRLVLMILLASVVPPLWGGAMYWLVVRCWPEREDSAGARVSAESDLLDDYQI